MAGMLPGVEAARRRRFHQSSSSSNQKNNYNVYGSDYSTISNSSRISSTCLYPQTHEFIHTNSSMDENRLGPEARQAKKRLDERLQHHNRRSETSKRKHEGAKRALKWLSWKSTEQEECAVCLDQLVRCGHTVMQLPCAHRFHTTCLVPWLETNAHCPCCRLEIHS